MRLLALVISVMLGGCAAEPLWIGGNETVLMKDLHECQVEAEIRWAAKYQTRATDLITAALESSVEKSVPELRGECMAARSWRAEYPPGTPSWQRPY
jgi:hypothetical protein